ncbi:MAG: FapA family protein [Spirochaetales bacterium]|jgi:uncharacterized protein (DUF342 family)|nr:FapA family protein [Spirochaetales bacterium]
MKKDGRFSIYYKDGFATLTVFPPENDGRPVYYEGVAGKLKLLEVPGVRKQLIYDIIDEAAGLPRPLVEWREGHKLSPRITVRIAEDKMRAFVSVQPEKPGGEPLSLPLLQKALREAGVFCGIEEDNLKKLLQSRTYGSEVTAASGRPPVHEQPEKIQYFFNTERGKPFKELDFERMDLRELNFIQNCSAGDTLARLGDPVPPEDGWDVTGRPVPALTGPVRSLFKAGTGAKLCEDGKTIVATIDGNVRLSGGVSGLVMVEPVITVEDVDYSNGNMDFSGALDIRGRVADGFTVKSQGVIQIAKSVSKVQVHSGGDMILKAGISCNDEGELDCGGNLFAKYIEGGRVVCRGSLFVEEAIMHSQVKVNGDIILAGRRAEIFGGRIICGGSLKCKKIGNISEPATEIILGLGIEDFETQETLSARQEADNEELGKLDTIIRQLKNTAAKFPADDPTALKLDKAIKQQEEKILVLTKRINRAARELYELKQRKLINEDCFLSAEEWIFPQTSVTIGDFRWQSSPKGHSKTTLRVRERKLYVQ